MAKRKSYCRFELVAVHAGDYGIDTTKPGWRLNDVRQQELDQHDVVYLGDRSDGQRDPSVARVSVRCGIPASIVVDALRRMASLIEREADLALVAEDGSYYNFGPIDLENGELHVSDELRSALKADQSAAA